MQFQYNQLIYLLLIGEIIADSEYVINSKKMICFGCKAKQQTLNGSSVQKSEETQYIVDSNQNTSQSKSKSKQLETQKQQQENSIYFSCSCCQNLFCLECCRQHKQKTSQKENEQNVENQKRSETQIQMNYQQLNTQSLNKKFQIICQECEDKNSVKYCQNCGQYLCQKCSFKIHNKGKRAKHTLEENIESNIHINHIVLLTKDWTKELQESNEDSPKFQDNFGLLVKEKLKLNREQTLFLVDKAYQKQKEKLSKKYFLDFYDAEDLKLQEILTMKNKYPFFDYCKIVVFSNQVNFHQNIMQEYQKKQIKNFKIQVQQEKKKQNQPKHERIFSQKVSITHNKNISNFSNLSAISKVENQSIISNQQSDIFQNNESSSLNVTLNQNSSILMMGDYEKEEKQEKKVEPKQQKQVDKPVLNRIYSIREENSNNEANNMSVSTQNSIRKRNRKWPIPYFQPMRIPKYEKGPKHDAQIYLRELAQKGILMIRRQKAEEYLLDPEISRSFVRNIGERQIEYVAYIIDFLSVQCLTWVIESVKEDKMTPNQKLIQSRLKESFDLKVNMKLWQSIIKYLQSSQYQQDYMQNTKIRYVPKITVVKYEDQYLLEFQERKWAYQDQQLLDQQEEEWTQFKQLITDYFNGKNQITGGRYGCVQYVKLNGPKPLRKCSLGKISMFVQEAINKGIIRYHKTLLVSNSENNNSFFSQKANSLDEASKLFQLQKELKVMAIQLALIDMFLEVPPNTQISLAQIPLNLKKSIIFDYTLVELGFPKLKNILNTLADKLILQTTKTHISYEITTNGAQTIQKIRKQAMQQNQYFLSHIVNQIGTIVHHYQSLTLEDLYNQLNTRLGFAFQYKLYQLPDFYQFVLYYCANVVTVQFVAGMFVVTSKYQQTYPVYQQTHRATYSQQTNPNYVNYYQNPIQESSKTTQKKMNPPKLDEMLEQPQIKDTIATPKFNSSTFIQSKKIGFGWSEYLGEDKREEKFQDQEDQDENHSRQMEHIINILDDGDISATRPKTVIVNEGLQQQQFYILPKFNQPGDEIDSFGAEKAQWVMADGVNKANKGQHTRFKSTNQVPTKHFRQYSTTNTKK